MAHKNAFDNFPLALNKATQDYTDYFVLHLTDIIQ